MTPFAVYTVDSPNGFQKGRKFPQSWPFRGNILTPIYMYYRPTWFLVHLRLHPSKYLGRSKHVFCWVDTNILEKISILCTGFRIKIADRNSPVPVQRSYPISAYNSTNQLDLRQRCMTNPTH